MDGPQHHGNDDHTDEEHQEEEPEIARLLDAGLDEPTRRRLGIPKGVKVTERMVSYLYNQLLDALDPSCYSKANDCMFDPAAIRADQGPDDDVELDTEDIADFVNMNLRVKAERLEAFIRSGLRGTHPDDAPHAGDYALGTTYISSWENPKSSRRRTTWRDTSEKDGRKPLKPWLLRDLDARWWSKSGAGKGAPYLLKAISGGRADSGSLKLTCPASTMAKHAVRCANKPASLPGRLDRIEIGTALPVITSTPKPAVCEKSTVTANFADLPFWQPHIPFTAEHQWSINRRNQVESAYGRIKDEATQSVRRGTFRVFGRAKVTFAVLLVAMAANLLEVARWRTRLAEATLTTGQPRRPSKPRLWTRPPSCSKSHPRSNPSAQSAPPASPAQFNRALNGADAFPSGRSARPAPWFGPGTGPARADDTTKPARTAETAAHGGQLSA